MSNFFTMKYWFASRPGDLDPKGMFILAGIVFILVIFTFISFLVKNRKRGLYYNIWSRVNSFCFSNMVIGLFLLFFVYQLIPFLSSRILLLIWLVEMIIWSVFIIRFALKIPEIIEKQNKENEYKKYIP